MRVITLNVNGIRASIRKGFFDWVYHQQADVICIQETKAQMNGLEKDHFCPKGFQCYYHDAERKGYSGVAIFSKREPDKITTGLGWSHADTEGRFIRADFGKLSIDSIYLPSGSSGEERQAIKFDFMKHYEKILKRDIACQRDIIICGDWNIVHKEIDIRNFKSNQKTSGCLPEERAWLDDVLSQVGWVDAFRVLNQNPDEYSWWSNRGRAWEKNVGWRIDYQIITPSLKDKVKNVRIYREKRFSDHAPVIVDYDYSY